jgi:predicted TIM-barrel fold metal-dependent hydrolase
MSISILFMLKTRPGLLAASIALLPALPAAATQPLFDAHLHFNADAASRYAPAQIITTLERNGVRRAAVTSLPPENVRHLYEAAPALIIPLLGVYRRTEDKETWMQDAGLPARLERMLRDELWRGVGELHLFAEQRRNPVFLRIVELASRHDLPLLLHCDPAVIDSLYEHSPVARVVWAHAGSYPYPDLLRDYLDRYPRLYIDLSMRDARIAPEGELDPDWERLLWEYPDRFMVGVDTFSVARWSGYDEAATRIRNWLAQLPEAVARRIAHRNAAVVFKPNAVIDKPE